MRDGARPFIWSKYALLIKYHDELRWRNFTKGRFVTLYVELQREEYIQGIETYVGRGADGAIDQTDSPSVVLSELEASLQEERRSYGAAP